MDKYTPITLVWLRTDIFGVQIDMNFNVVYLSQLDMISTSFGLPICIEVYFKQTTVR